MRLVFFLEPWVELGNPRFRYGALKNQVRRLAMQLTAAGHSVRVVIGDAVALAVEVEGLELPAVDVVTISQRDLLRHFRSSAAAARAVHLNEVSEDALNAYGELFRAALGTDYQPDVVLSWEASIPQLRAAYPSALFLHLMPGFMSRVPYPELLSIDPRGLFQNSTLVAEARFFRDRQPTKQEAEFLRQVREHYLDGFLVQANPFPPQRLDPYRKFSRLILLPLQVSGYFAFDATSSYSNGMDFVLDVLNSVPSDVGVVVSQYVTPNIEDRVLNPTTLEFLRSKYPNLIYDVEFDKVDSVSQYLLSSVDGVACVSSSIGFQALLWRKPIFVFGDSHLSPFSSGRDAESIARALDGSGANYDGALAYLLTRMQPLLLSRCYESTWFSDFVSMALGAHRAGRTGVELFDPIDDLEAYTREFVGASKRARALQKLNQARVARLDMDSLGELAPPAAVAVRGGHSIVTFDVFDTLVARPFARPVDLFSFMEPQVSDITGGRLPCFRDLRVGAEAACRARVKDSTGAQSREITLAEIYTELAEQLELDQAVADQLMELELATERRFLKTRPAGLQAYEAASRAGAPIYLVSDMYLPKTFLEEVLRDLGFVAHRELLLSSELGSRKHEGELFDVLLERTGMPPDAILHIGDNAHGDRDVPRAKGIRAVHLPSAIVNLHSHDRWGKVFRGQRGSQSLSRSMVLGVTANRLFDETGALKGSHFGGNLRALGYFGLGWMFVGMVQWLIAQARRDGIEVLYFLSRDGEIIQSVFSQLAPSHHEGVPEAKYLLSSRRAAQVAGIQSRSDVVEVAATPFRRGTTADFLRKKFGLSEEEMACVPESLLGVEVGGVPGQATRVRAALIAESAILAHAEQERQAYRAYLEQQGLCQDKRIAIVDIGYAGSMQKALLSLTGRSQLAGYYMMTFESARSLVDEGQICRAYVADFVDKTVCPHPFARHGLMFEVLLSNEQSSLARFEVDADGQPIPRFQQAKLTPPMKHFQREARVGLADFVDDLIATYGDDIRRLQLDADTSLLPLTKLFEVPSAEDARMFLGITFDDDFGGAGIRYAVGPTSDPDLVRAGDAVWRPGLEAIRAARRAPKARNEEARSGLGRMQEPMGQMAAVVVQHIAERVTRRFSSPAKHRKLLRNPAQFYKDSSYPFVRWVSRFY